MWAHSGEGSDDLSGGGGEWEGGASLGERAGAVGDCQGGCLEVFSSALLKLARSCSCRVLYCKTHRCSSVCLVGLDNGGGAGAVGSVCGHNFSVRNLSG